MNGKRQFFVLPFNYVCGGYVGIVYFQNVVIFTIIITFEAGSEAKEKESFHEYENL